MIIWQWIVVWMNVECIWRVSDKKKTHTSTQQLSHLDALNDIQRVHLFVCVCVFFLEDRDNAPKSSNSCSLEWVSVVVVVVYSSSYTAATYVTIKHISYHSIYWNSLFKNFIPLIIQIRYGNCIQCFFWSFFIFFIEIVVCSVSMCECVFFFGELLLCKTLL